ncbi:MAG: BatD family protein [Parashewanella sp.]
MVKRLFILILASISAIHSAWALDEIVASVDRNPVINGEYFTLTVSANDDVDTNKLDSSVLEKNFIIGRVSVSRSTKIINFNSAKETRWQILLAPKHKGIVTVPSFTIDGVKSNEIALQVVNDNKAQQKNKDIYITTELSQKQGYVGQLLLYKIKLYLAVDLQRGSLNAPQIANASVKQIGDDKEGTEIVNGRRFRVIERTYGVISDKAGELAIGATSFQGDVLTTTNRRNSLFSFNESRPVRVNSDSNKITILPKPDNFQGEWLVSELVKLKEQWPKNQKEYQAGAPITRTISLLAVNADDTSLPDIATTLPAGLKGYPEKPQRKTYVRDGHIVAELSQTQAIVPSHSGKFTLPEVKVPWWNPVLKRQELATLPARTITVVGDVTPQPATTSTITPQQISSTQKVVHTVSAGYWPWLTALFALLWLITLFLLFKRKNTQSNNIESHEPQPCRPTTKQVNEIKKACDKKQYGDVLTLLQCYCSSQLNKQMNLADIKQLSSELSDIINRLQAISYADTQQTSQQSVNTDDLINAIHSVFKEQKNSKSDNQQNKLVKLNPID